MSSVKESSGEQAPVKMAAREVRVFYGDKEALHGVDLDVPANEVLALIGPSGCGKSTLLRLLIGLLAPSSGEVRFDGQRLTPRVLPGARRRIGYVIQEGGLFPHLDARANITVMARHLRWSAERIEARLEALRALTHFPERALARYPAELSGGQNQRVALMRALMLDPEALLLDEPLGALDPMIRHDLQQELAEIFARLGKTVVLVTHDLAEAAFLGHALVLMRDGRIVQQGTAEALRRAPAEAFVERFLAAQRGPGGVAI